MQCAWDNVHVVLLVYARVKFYGSLEGAGIGVPRLKYASASRLPRLTWKIKAVCKCIEFKRLHLNSEHVSFRFLQNYWRRAVGGRNHGWFSLKYVAFMWNWIASGRWKSARDTIRSGSSSTGCVVSVKSECRSEKSQKALYVHAPSPSWNINHFLVIQSLYFLRTFLFPYNSWSCVIFRKRQLWRFQM